VKIFLEFVYRATILTNFRWGKMYVIIGSHFCAAWRLIFTYSISYCKGHIKCDSASNAPKCPLDNGVSIVQKLVVKLWNTLTMLFLASKICRYWYYSYQGFTSGKYAGVNHNVGKNSLFISFMFIYRWKNMKFIEI
jgi:hypothetical protein